MTPTPFNTTANVTSVMELGAYNSEITGDGFGIFLLFVIALTVFGVTFSATRNSKNAVVASAVVCTFASSLLVILGWIGSTPMLVCVAVLVGAILLVRTIP